jgi:MFS family permease
MSALGGGFRALWTATGTANLGDGVLLVGAPLLAAGLTRSPLQVALVSAATWTPWLVVGLVAGALADRHDRRAILRAASAGRAVVLGAAAVATALGYLSIPLLAVTVLLVGVGEVFADTSAQSLLPALVPADRLDAANGRLTSTETVANHLAGGPLAGVLVSFAAVPVLAVPALLYAAAAGAASALRVPAAPGPAPVRESVRAGIAAGIRHLAGHRALRTLALFCAAMNCANGAYQAMLVLWCVGPESQVGLSPAGYGALTAALAAGAVAGALLTGRLCRRFGVVPTLLGAASCTYLPLLLPVAVPRFWTAAAGLVVAGAGSAAVNVVVVSSRQRLVPAHLFGRVNAAFRLLAMGASPVGALLGGAVAALAGLATALSGACALGLAAAMVAGPVLLRSSLDAKKPAERETTNA